MHHLPQNIRLFGKKVVLELNRLIVLLLQDDPTSLFKGKFEGDLVVLGNSTVSLSLPEHLLHIFPIAVNIYDGGPILYPNNKHFHLYSSLNIRLFAHLQMLKFKHSCFTSFHAGDQSLDVEVLPTEVILQELAIHQEECGKIMGIAIDFGCVLAFLSFLFRVADLFSIEVLLFI